MKNNLTYGWILVFIISIIPLMKIHEPYILIVTAIISVQLIIHNEK